MFNIPAVALCRRLNRYRARSAVRPPERGDRRRRAPGRAGRRPHDPDAPAVGLVGRRGSGRRDRRRGIDLPVGTRSPPPVGDGVAGRGRRRRDGARMGRVGRSRDVPRAVQRAVFAGGTDEGTGAR